MKRLALPALAALVAATPTMAQAPKVSGLLQVWYTQMLNDNLRVDSAATTNGNKYYDLSSNFTENSFVLRRAEIHVSGDIASVQGLSYEFNIDPSINTSAANPTILQDAFLTYTHESGFDLRVGQMKTYQTFEGFNGASTLIFAERSQLGRIFGDKRDRGVAVGYKFGDADFGGKATLAVFNGMTNATSGKSGDTNAQKDFVARLEFNAGKDQKFGVYGLSGSTDQSDKGGLVALTFAGVNTPSATDILADKDKTTNYGAFYVYDNGTWHFDGEAITGSLGRRAASLNGAAGAAKREALGQKYLGFYATAAYTMGAHTFALRYDRMNYNQGDKWYTAFDPYTQSAPGTARLVNGAPVDYTPKYTEATAGYTYAFNPKLVKAANLKVNYIWRSKNFLAPNASQTGEQGGDSAVVAFQITF